MRRGIAGRFGFLYVCAYFVIYLFPFPLDMIPGTGPLFKPWSQAVNALIDWTAVHVLQIPVPLRYPVNGSGDTTEAFVRVLCNAALALVVALILLPMTSSKAVPRIHQALRVLLRFNLGGAMLSYAFIKIFKNQFPFPSPLRLTETYGDSSPHALMWNFMGYSATYSFFAGTMELFGGMLVFFRRTTTLGALLLVGVMGNVVMLNLSYDVAAKLSSMHLLAMAVVLAIPDARRLLDLLLLNRATQAVPEPRAPRWRRYAARAAQLLFIGYAVYDDASSSMQRVAQSGDNAPRPPTYGAYQVEAMLTDRPLLGWLALGIEIDQLALRTGDRFQERYTLKDDAASRLLTIGDRFEPAKVHGILGYAPLADAGLLLVGSYEGVVVTVRLSKIDLSKSLLVNRGFYWINEQPFNR